MPQTNIKVETKSDTRQGVYANLSLATTSRKESVLNFFFADSGSEEDDIVTINAVLVAKVIMSHEALVELRDMLDEHISKSLEVVETK